MTRFGGLCLAIATLPPALVGIVSAPHLTDYAPFHTAGAAYVFMMGASIALIAMGAVGLLSMVVGEK